MSRSRIYEITMKDGVTVNGSNKAFVESHSEFGATKALTDFLVADISRATPLSILTEINNRQGGTSTAIILSSAQGDTRGDESGADGALDHSDEHTEVDDPVMTTEFKNATAGDDFNLGPEEDM